MFANVEYWKKIGEEYQQPLIVTGTVMFTPQQRNGIVQREEEVYDSFGRRRVVPVRHLHGAQGLHPAAEVRLHRRPHRHRDAFRERSAKKCSTTPTRPPRRCPRISS